MGTQIDTHLPGKYGVSGLLTDSDYIKQNHEEIFGEYLNNPNKNIDLCAPGIDRLTGSMTFFRPDKVFIDWLVEYADDRIVVDVGCGSGHICRMMTEAGGKMVGIDPYMDINSMMNIQMSLMETGNSAHMLPWGIADTQTKNMYQGQGNKILLMYCRPCHSNFVQEGIKLADDSTEILYITKPSVMVEFNDLGPYETYAELIPHKGFSVDREKVWSIRKGNK